MRTRRIRPALALLIGLGLAACTSERAAPAAAPETKPAETKPAETKPAETKPEAAEPAGSSAALGQPAPDFSLADLDGKTHTLAEYRGKTVVLEWFNPECPFVNYAHGDGELKSMAAKVVPEGIVWLAINSGAPGKQGHGLDANKAGVAKFGMTHPVLLDESGAVGHLYGAEKTPHMFVIDGAGALVYRGAIDNAPMGEVRESGAPKKNHVADALADLAAGRPVATPETAAYGCTVKYAK
ncbi:MAG: redoxin domain-containing protein [Nannocystaceae bacterium]